MKSMPDVTLNTYIWLWPADRALVRGCCSSCPPVVFAPLPAAPCPLLHLPGNKQPTHETSHYTFILVSHRLNSSLTDAARCGSAGPIKVHCVLCAGLCGLKDTGHLTAFNPAPYCQNGSFNAYPHTQSIYVGSHALIF